MLEIQDNLRIALVFLNILSNNPFVRICWIDQMYNDLDIYMHVTHSRSKEPPSQVFPCGSHDFDTRRNKQFMCHYLPYTCSKLKQQTSKFYCRSKLLSKNTKEVEATLN